MLTGIANNEDLYSLDPEGSIIGSADAMDAATCAERDRVGPTTKNMTNESTPAQYVGMNGFVDDPIDILAIAGHVREYHNWRFNEPGKDYPGYPHNAIRFEGVGGWERGWNFDEYYADMVEAGVDVVPCIQGSVPWLFDDGFDPDRKPVPPGKRSTDPTAYAAHAHFMFQYAARYGSTEVEADLLTLADDQEEMSGLGLIASIENWNEPNNDWSHPEAWFEPEEFAAMTSADYDGHEGELGDTYGVKNADPNMTFVLGGTAEMSIEYFKDMYKWFQDNRNDEKFAADVINVHHYTRDGDPETPALSPEEDDVRGRMKEVIAFRDEYVPDAEVWITEFGWDTHPQSPVRPEVNDPYDIYDVQAQWLVRSYLEYAAAGADRATMYMSRDVDDPDATQYATSGLTDGKDEWNRRPSWYHLAALGTILDGLSYADQIDTTLDDVRIYRFEAEESDAVTYAIWSATSEGRSIDEATISLPDWHEGSVTVLELIEDASTPSEQSLDSNADGEITLTISEEVKFIQITSDE